MTIRLVDQQQVSPDHVDAFVAAIHEQGVPLMRGAGADFVACEVTSSELGEDVDVLTAWSFDDFVAWNRIRRDLLADPRYRAYAAALAGMRTGGTRRFYSQQPTGFAAPALEQHDDHDPSADGSSPALRRWEMFSLAPDAVPAAVARLRRAMQECNRYIPGISRCAVGINTAGPPIDLVWETTFESFAAYRNYMTHPYHACVLDRFLLPDCPERITTANQLGAGLIGYAADRGDLAGPVAVRRLLLLDFRADADAASRCAAAVHDAKHDGLTASVFAENTLSTRWFDGVNEMGGVAAWTHLWDQCFASVADFDRHRRGDGSTAEVERALESNADLRPARMTETAYVPELTEV